MIFINNVNKMLKGCSEDYNNKCCKITGERWELLIEYKENNNEIKINSIKYIQYDNCDGSIYQYAQIGVYDYWKGYEYKQIKKYELYFTNEYKEIIKYSKSFLTNYNKAVIKNRKEISLKILEEYSYKTLRRAIKELDELLQKEEL